MINFIFIFFNDTLIHYMKNNVYIYIHIYIYVYIYMYIYMYIYILYNIYRHCKLQISSKMLLEILLCACFWPMLGSIVWAYDVEPKWTLY